MPPKKKRPPAPAEALAELLTALATPRPARRRSRTRTGRLVREVWRLCWRYRHQLAPIAVMVGVLVAGYQSVGVGRAARTYAAAGGLGAGGAWLFTRAWLDRAAERAYAAVCLAATGGWLAWVSVAGLSRPAVKVWAAGGVLLAVPWWVHYRVRLAAAGAGRSAEDAAALAAAVDAGVADEDAVGDAPVWTVTTLPAGQPAAAPAPGAVAEPAAGGAVVAAEPAPDGPDHLEQAALDAAAVVTVGPRADRRTLTLSQPVVVLPNGARTWEYQLPAGQTARAGMARHYEWASALGVPVEWLDVRRGRSEQHLALWVAGSDPWGGAAPRCPLVLQPRRTSLWEPADLGRDVRGEPVHLRLTHPTSCSLLIGGQRGAGKTNSAMNLRAHVLCDPTVRVWGADPKPDSKPFRELAYRWVGDDKRDLIVMLEELEAGMRRKFRFLESIDRVEVDPALAAQYPDDLQVDVLDIDELADYTLSPGSGRDPVVERIVELLAKLLQLGRAAAVYPVLCTQRPSAAVVPTIIRANIQVRWALRCDGATSSNMVLGDGAAGRGWDASEITQLGVGILNNNGVYRRLQSNHLGEQTVDMREVIVPFARQLRADAGTLPTGPVAPARAARPAAAVDEAGCAGLVLGLLGERGEMSKADLDAACAGRFAPRTVADALTALQLAPARVVKKGRGRYALAS